MNIINQRVDDLIPYVNNPRDNDAAVDAVMHSIREFGFKVPIVVDRDNTIITGHTRLKAAYQLGLQEVPTIIADDLDENQVRAYRLADNKVSELSTWANDMLMQEMQDIEDIDMEQFGFGDLAAEFDLQDIEDDDFDPDSEPPADPTAKPGDIYQLGKHRVMCGDSTKKEDAARLMDGQLARLVVTDPPYNVDYTGKTKEALQIGNDKMTDAAFLSFLTDAFSAMKDSMMDGAAFYIWHADSKRYEFETALHLVELTVKQTLVWVKQTMVLGRQDYQWKHEPALYGWKDGAAHYFIDDRTKTTVIEDAPNLNAMDKNQLRAYTKELIEHRDEGSTILRADKPNASTEHPTMKPIKLMAQNIRHSSERGDIVLDLFGGSGSTLIACEQLDRSCYMMEYDPRYVDVIVNRWEQYTGQKATRIN